jgi:hypothetical protein
MHTLDAAYNLVHDYPGGAHSLGPRMGKSPNTLNHEVAGDGSAKFGLVDAVKATILSNNFNILYAFAEECDHMCIPLPPSDGNPTSSILAGLAKSSERFAELCNQVINSAADGEINDNELARIQRARSELLTHLAQLGQAAIQLNQASKPAGGI